MNEIVETPIGLTMLRTHVVGEKITENGMYDMSIESYHGDPCDGPSISSSGLRTIFREDEGPAHYFVHSPYNPDRLEREETEAFRFGRAAHHLFLGEKDFRKFFTIQPAELDGEPWHGNRTSCKKWLAARAAEKITVLKGKDVEHIRGMAASIERHPFAKDILRGQIERSLIYKDPGTGIWVKSRPDAIPNDSGDFGDLKTTASVGYDAIQRTIHDMGYHQQGALLRSAARVVLGMEMQSFTLVFIEKTPPYSIRVVTLRPEDLDRGQEANELALRYFKKCLETGFWPGPGGTQSDAQYIGLSDWQMKMHDLRTMMLRQEIEN